MEFFNSKVTDIQWTGTTGVNDLTDLAGTPTEFNLERNYPDPFNPETTHDSIYKEISNV